MPNLFHTTSSGASLQRESAEGLSLEVDYVGANAHHLGDGGYQMTESQNDQLPDADLALGGKLLQQVPNRSMASPPAPQRLARQPLPMANSCVLAAVHRLGHDRRRQPKYDL